jgi:hypothetical protein
MLTPSFAECSDGERSPPLGLPYSPLADDKYIEYCIPKGSSVLINKKAINHDANIFTNPDSFYSMCRSPYIDA